MNTVKNLLDTINKDLSTIVGLRVKNSDEYHSKKRDIICKNIPNGMKYNTWGVKLANTYQDIFTIEFSIDRDKRVKNNMAGTIEKTSLVPVFKDIDTSLPLESYLTEIKKINLIKKIEGQKETIENKKKELSESIAYLDNLVNEFEQLTTAN